MKVKGALVFLLLMVSFISCKWMAECFPEFTGTVLSNVTKTPIAGATVELLNKNIKVKSDENGFFKLSASGCFDANLKISKEHYKPFEITITNSADANSYKIKSASISVDYHDRFYPNPKDKSTFTTRTWIKQSSESFSVTSDQLIYYLDTLKSISEEIADSKKVIKK